MSRHSNTPATDASVLLVQLSDSHLFAEDGARLLGMDTAHSLKRWSSGSPGSNRGST